MSLARSLLAALVLATACSDSEEVVDRAANIPDPAAAASGSAGGSLQGALKRDSVLKIVGAGPLTANGPADTILVVSGHRGRLLFTQNGLFRLVLLRNGNVARDAKVDRALDTPLLFENDQLIARSWAEYDALAKTRMLPDPSAL
jgi:hypothetical protein